MVKKVGVYALGKTLGEGTYGKVKLATNMENQQMFAIKVLDKAKIKEHKMDAQVKQEISIMKLLKHEHVVNLIEVLASKNNIFLVLELVTGGELFDKIVQAGRLSENEARKYFQELVAGVAQCHSMGVCHRDLKPENLLLDAKGHLKISDFGLSSMISNPATPGSEAGASVLHTTCGTPNYVAPEVLANKGYDGRAADIWSCGVILFVLMAGYLPFDEPTWPALFKKIMEAQFSYPKFFSEPAKEFLNHLLIPDPAQRYTIQQITAHPWFQTNLREQLFTQGRAPTSAEVGQAVQAFHVDSVSVEKLNVAGGDAGASTAGPAKMNAFELIAQGIDLSTMFLKKADKDAMNVSRITRFSTETGPQEALTHLQRACESLRLDCQVNDQKFKAMLTQQSRLGVLTCAVTIYQMAPRLLLVDFRRGKGDTLEYHKLYKSIADQLRPIITQSTSSSSSSSAAAASS